ncbi:MAG: ELWxxDGT repeat protein [bacterium]
MRDVRTLPTNASSAPYDFTDAAGVTYFFAAGGLWRTDGTTDGTVAAAALHPGSQFDFRPTMLGALGTVVLFALGQDDTGIELWRSDGTAGGTGLVVDIAPGAASAAPRNAVALGSWLLFTASDSTDGRELWRTDGSAAGTVRVADLNPGPGDSQPQQLTRVGDRVYFTTGNGNGRLFQLWITDGTTAGTVPVAGADSNDLSASPQWLTAVGDTLYFASGDVESGKELWAVNAAGAARPVVDLLPGAEGSAPRGLVAHDGLVCFFAAGPDGRDLWCSDGTAAGTHGVETGAVQPGDLISVGDLLFFSTREQFPRTEVHPGRDLWRSDGTQAGTVRLSTLYSDDPGGHYATLVDLQGRLLFAVNGGFTPYGNRLGYSDGTIAGTGSLPTAAATALRVLGDTAYFAGSSDLGSEPWRTDGTSDGTRLLRDIATGADAYPQQLTAYGRELLFTARDDESSRALWRSDGTAEGTSRVLTGPIGALFVDREAIYVTDDGFAAPLVHYDGSSTTPLVDLSSDGAILGAHAGQLLLRVGDGTHDTALWRSDGTPQGTVALGGGSSPAGFAVLGDQIFFAATGAQGRELWRTNGAPAGTTIVADINPGPADSNPYGIVASGGRLFFSAIGSGFDSELWQSDGTAAGTRLVKDINLGPSPSLPYNLTVLRPGTIVFLADDGVHGWEPWRSDGTEAGTFLLADVFAGAERSIDPSQPVTTRFAVAGGLAFFVADDGTHGTELWCTDGTPGGTRLVRDVVDGPGSAFAPGLDPYLTGVGSLVLFTAADTDHGRELWCSDGRAAGTRLVDDVAGGPESSNPGPYAPVAGAVYFAADDGTHGNELWTLPADTLLAACPGDCDADGAVGVGEVVTAVGRALEQPGMVCAAADRDLDGVVSIAELLLAVGAALNGC